MNTDFTDEYPATGNQRLDVEEAGSPVVRWLDRTIITLMVAILLTLSWPVSLALWSSRHSGPSNVTGSNPNYPDSGATRSSAPPSELEIARHLPRQTKRNG